MHRALARRAGAVILELVAVDKARLPVDIGAARGLGENLARAGAVGRVQGGPERGVHHHRMVGGPEAARLLDADEAQDIGIAPGFGGHPRRPSRAAHLHFHGKMVIDQQRLLPPRHPAGAGGFDDMALDVQERPQQRQRAGGGPSLHPADRRAGRADRREIQQQNLPARPGEGHGFQNLHRLGPALAAVGDHVPARVGRCLRLGQVRRRVLAQHPRRVGVIRVIGGQPEAQRRRLRPVHRDQRVVIGPADAGAVQQQVELDEGGDGGGAVGEHLDVAPRLIGIAVLQVPPGGEQRAGGDGVAQPRLFDRGLGVGAAEQGDVAGRHPVGDPAEAGRVLRAEHGAAGDRDAHAGAERAGRQRGFAERGAGQGTGRQVERHGDGSCWTHI
jgi:hypothetical protein